MVEPSVTQPPGVRFGSFELTLNTGELKKDGTRINLHGQPIEILTLLLQTPGELVTREELRQKLWSKDTFVDFEHGLNAAVKRLRAALADDADAPRYIETIPRRGYRFVAQVERSPTLSTIVETTPAPAEKPSVRATRWRIAAAALVVTGLVVATAYL